MMYLRLKEIPSYVHDVFDGEVPTNRDTIVRWSGKHTPPAIGDRIKITFNGFGMATVNGYFIEAGWLGLLCSIDVQPDWHKRQGGSKHEVHVFGVEFEPV